MKKNRYFFLGILLLSVLLCSCKKDNGPTAAQTASPTAIDWVTIPAGSFIMGDTSATANSDEKPLHSVSLDAFRISSTEVTFAQYDAFCDSTHRKRASDYGWGRGNRPVIWVTYKDATDYCAWLAKQIGADTVRLPTEAEWEYAARGGAAVIKFAGTDDINQLANYAWFSGSSTQPVASKLPNAFGLYDMSGNAWEWCLDYYASYTKDSVANPKGPLSGGNRVIRGGAWGWTQLYCRTTQRMSVPPASSEFSIGFRVVRK